MDSWKAEVRRVRRDKIRRKKMQVRERVGKSRNTVFFQWFGAPEGRKVGSLKRRVRSQLATGAMKNCTPLWREAHFQVKSYKTPQLQTTFGSWDDEKVRAVVARSTFPSRNVQNTPWSDHFWKLRCRKSARRCVSRWQAKKLGCVTWCCHLRGWCVVSLVGTPDICTRHLRWNGVRVLGPSTWSITICIGISSKIWFNQGSSFYVSLVPKGCVMMLGNVGFYVVDNL